jgi:hypothetical protein
MIDYVIQEPSFSASPTRCFKLPFVVTEALISGSSHLMGLIFGENPQILVKLFSFIHGEKQPLLNPTLGGFFNKIVSFFLLKETDKTLSFIIN